MQLIEPLLYGLIFIFDWNLKRLDVTKNVVASSGLFILNEFNPQSVIFMAVLLSEDPELLVSTHFWNLVAAIDTVLVLVMRIGPIFHQKSNDSTAHVFIDGNMQRCEPILEVPVINIGSTHKELFAAHEILSKHKNYESCKTCLSIFVVIIFCS